MKFKLYFSSNTLYKISLERNSCVTLTRGKTSNYQGSFQWTEAVKGLCQILLSYNLELGNSLTGTRNSKTSSLDYALSKPPIWMQELFEIKNNDLNLIRRLFQRINPEGKLAGPTTISLNTNLIQKNDIEIYIESYLASVHEKNNLLAHLDLNNNFSSKLIQLYTAESLQSLKDNKLFLQNSYNSTIKKLVDSQSVKNIFPKRDIFKTLINSRIKNNFIPDFKIPELEFATTYANAGAIAVFSNLLNKYKIKVNFKFPYAVPLANNILDFHYQPDICCLGWGPALKVLSNTKDYLPLALGPRISHKIISTDNQDYSTLLMVNDEPTTASFCLDSLKEHNHISKKIKVTHHEPDEIHFLAKNKQLSNTLLWFPHYNLIDVANKFNENLNDEFYQYTLILIHRKNMYLFNQLKQAINNSWYEVANSDSVENLTASYMSNEYTNDIKNYTWAS